MSTPPINSARNQPAGSPRKRVELKVVSDPATLSTARKTVEALAAENGFDPVTVAHLGLCVNEAMANIIRHAYAGRTDRPIDVTAWVDEPARELTVTLRDWGNGVDPTTLPPKPYDPLEPGGVGLICLRQWLDEIRFDRQPGGGILTTMRKKKE